MPTCRNLEAVVVGSDLEGGEFSPGLSPSEQHCRLLNRHSPSLSIGVFLSGTACPGAKQVRDRGEGLIEFPLLYSHAVTKL